MAPCIPPKSTRCPSSPLVLMLSAAPARAGGPLFGVAPEQPDEKRNGLVRWARPDFQNPGGLEAPTQEPLAGVEPADDDEAAEPAGPPAALAAWPKQ